MNPGDDTDQRLYRLECAYQRTRAELALLDTRIDAVTRANADLRAQLATARHALEKLAALGCDEAESDAMNAVMWAGEVAREALAALDAAGGGARG